MCLGTPEGLKRELVKALVPSLELEGSTLGNGAFAKTMVPGGVLLWLKVTDQSPCCRAQKWWLCRLRLVGATSWRRVVAVGG